MTMSTSITPDTGVTDGQLKQFRRFVEDAAAKAAGLALEQVPFDKESIQRLLENGDELQAAILATIIAKSRELSLTNQFANEEVASTYGYLSGYTKPIGITQQTNRLRELFPGIGYADEKLAEQPLPGGAEGYFAIPRWDKVAPTYGEAVQKVLDLIKQTRDGKFYNYIEGQLGPQYLRQQVKTVAAFQRLGEAQSGYDILVVPAQFGLAHRGRSVRRACEVMNASEFGLGLFAGLMMLLTHENRLQHYNDLWMDLPGDERDPDADGSFDFAPYLGFNDGKVKLFGKFVSNASGSYGSASGFGSQDDPCISNT
jgi:hypothetical protein